MRFGQLVGFVFGCTFALAACDSARVPSLSAVAPSPVAPVPPGLNGVHWRADAVVTESAGGRACGWGTAAGETRSGVEWRITLTGTALLLEEDMANWPTDHIPYSGTLTDRQFTASYSQAGYLRYECQFRGGELAGHFSSDFSSFEAVETLVWGAPGEETAVRRRWTGLRP